MAFYSDTDSVFADEELRLDVDDRWLQLIANGSKKVEGRKGSPAHKLYQGWKVGDSLLFYSPRRGVHVKLLAIRHYPDLKSFLVAEGWDKVCPDVHSYQEAEAEYSKYYTTEKIAKAGGVMAFEIQAIHSYPALKIKL